jgi:hypothetical protein
MTYRRWLTIVFSILLATFATIVFCMVRVTRIVTAPDFLKDLGDPTLIAEEKPFAMRNAQCEVLIYGDSSAMTGVDPRVIKADTGLTTCNVAATWPIVSLLGTMPIDAFLEHNPPPKFLVIQLAPRTFYMRNDWDEVANLGPLSMVLRQRPGLSTDWLMARHGGASVKFFFDVLKNARPPDAAKQERTAEFHRIYDSQLEEYDRNAAMLTLVQPTQTSCVVPPEVLPQALDASWLKELRSRYQRNGTVVLIKASPIPACDPQLQFYQKALAPYVDENIEALPITDFVVGDRHMTPQGALDESHQLAALIMRKESH